MYYVVLCCTRGIPNLDIYHNLDIYLGLDVYSYSIFHDSVKFSCVVHLMGPSSFCFCGSALQSRFKTAAAAAPIPTQLGEIIFEVVLLFQEIYILIPHSHSFYYPGHHYCNFLRMYTQGRDFCISRGPLTVPLT